MKEKRGRNPEKEALKLLVGLMWATPAILMLVYAKFGFIYPWMKSDWGEILRQHVIRALN